MIATIDTGLDIEEQLSVLLETKRFDEVVWESIGPDSGEAHEESIAHAILTDDWLELGNLIGPKAKQYLLDSIRRQVEDKQ